MLITSSETEVKSTGPNVEGTSESGPGTPGKLDSDSASGEDVHCLATPEYY